MAYVAGYVARRTAHGQPSARSETEDEPLEVLWTRLRSMGGLNIPSAGFLDVFRDMEQVFRAYHEAHPDHLSRQPGVTRRLTRALLRRHPRLPVSVIRRFTRTRTFIRMGDLNRRRRQDALERREKRKRKSCAK